MMPKNDEEEKRRKSFFHSIFDLPVSAAVDEKMPIRNDDTHRAPLRCFDKWQIMKRVTFFNVHRKLHRSTMPSPPRDVICFVLTKND